MTDAQGRFTMPEGDRQFHVGMAAMSPSSNRNIAV